MKKALIPAEAVHLEHIPNLGVSIAGDLRGIGIKTPKDLRGKDPLVLYKKVNLSTQQVHDPCLLDVFMAAVAFMDGKGAAPWFAFTKRRKILLSKIKEG
jgi:hypothetical protein